MARLPLTYPQGLLDPLQGLVPGHRAYYSDHRSAVDRDSTLLAPEDLGSGDPLVRVIDADLVRPDLTLERYPRTGGSGPLKVPTRRISLLSRSITVTFQLAW